MELVKLERQEQNNEGPGKLTVWRTSGPLDDMVFELAANLTANGERLIVLDSTGCFDPARVSRAAASVATNLHVLRTAQGSELHTALWSGLRDLQQRTHAQQILLVGALDHLTTRGSLRVRRREHWAD